MRSTDCLPPVPMLLRVVMVLNVGFIAACGMLGGGLASSRTPEALRATSEEVALGKQLFFDPRLSANQSLSCATCHDPALGFADGRPLARGFNGKPLRRHTPHLFNMINRRAFFWDGRAETLEAQALGPITNPDEMNMPLEALSRRLSAIPGYTSAFSRTYPGEGISGETIARAIAAFERTLVANDSAYDRYQRGDRMALSDAGLRGLQLFNGKALCSRCHTGPDFTDDKFHNTGVPGDDPGRAAIDRTGEFVTTPYPFFQTQKAFKTPGLRNVALTAPYMHNGSEATLDDVVRFYNQGGKEPDSYGLSLNVRALNLSDADIADLVEFLKSLTSPVAIDPPLLPE